MNDTGLVTVRLWGVLADEFGHEHHFAISSPGEAVRALDANYPNFRRAMIRYPAYHIRADGDWREGRLGILAPVSRELDIVPAVEGAGLETLLATAVIAPMLTSAGVAAATAATIASVIAPLIITALLVGVSLLLTPKPKKKTKDDKKEDSFIFSGPEATIGQGAAVPLIYGRCWVGPTVISAGIETGEEKIEGATATVSATTNTTTNVRHINNTQNVSNPQH